MDALNAPSLSKKTETPQARGLSVRDLTVRLPVEDGMLRVVRGVSFDVAPGEFVAIVGESGCGKSMTAMSLTRLPPTDRAELSGEVRIDGRDLLSLSPRDLRHVRGREIAYIFQDPLSSLNPVLSVRAQMREALPPGMPHAEADRILLDLLETVRVPDPKRVLHAYPHELSGGLQQRVGIAMAVAASPRILVADEPTTALDVTTQRSVLDLLDRLCRERGIGLLLITHNLGVVARYADTVHVMYAGEIVESGPVADVLAHPAHPYTEGLLAAVPSLDLRSIDDLRGIPGRVPPPSEWGEDCAFKPRCPRGAECSARTTGDVSRSPFPVSRSAVNTGTTGKLENRKTGKPENPGVGTGRCGHLVLCRRAGFSLLELMGVLLILSMLAGLVVGQSFLAKIRGEEARARAELGQIQAALERYREAFGEYPCSTSEAGGEAQDFCEVTNLYAWAHAPEWMLVEGNDETFCLRNYFPEANNSRSDAAPSFTGLDPWNRPYYYHHAPDVSPDTYRVYSRGPNDPDGTNPERWIAP